MSVATLFGGLCLLLAVAGIGYQVHVLVAMKAFARAPRPAPAPIEPVTLLKPLHGLEPRLADNLATFLDQDWSAPIQIVFGTNRRDDPALPIARAVPAAVTTDAPRLGANAKVSNLANMMPAAAHDLLILSDSDMAVPRDYVARIAAALAQPGVGAVSCLYHGRGDAGLWSRLLAAAIDWSFTPAVMMSLALKVDQPCMGSTIALRRATLEAIGGFPALADHLADDHAIGAAVQALGLRVEMVPGLLLTHACTEPSFAALWRHELRWAGTVRVVTGVRYLGLLFTNPLPLALLGLAVFPLAGLAVAIAAIAIRLAVARRTARIVGSAPTTLVWLPARDLLSFVVYVASFLVRRVDWRGTMLKMTSKGRIASPEEFPVP